MVYHQRRSNSRIRIFILLSGMCLWMALIFFLSSQPAQESSQLSMAITGRILKAISLFVSNLGVSDASIDQYDNLIRKSAHALNFFILSIIVINALYAMGIRGIRAPIYSIIITVMYALSDEIHQLYVPGRGCMFSDVVIDSAGALLGLMTFMFMRWIFRRTSNNQSYGNIETKM